MTSKPAYEELEKRIKELEQEVASCKQVEEAIRESEERFLLAFENANDGICMVDTNGNLLKVNSRMGDIFGYSKKELESMTVNNIAHPEDKNISPKFINKSMSGEVENAVFEKRYIHKQGHIIYGQVSSSIIKDAKGVPLYFISHVQDITIGKKAEEALRESEEKYRTLVETNPYGIQSIDTTGIITYTNFAYQEMLGYTKEELLGKSILNLLEPISKRDELREYLPILVKEQPQPTTYFQKNRTKDGRVIDMEVAWKYNRNNEGSVVGFTSVVTDVKERKRAEEALSESEEKFKMLFENAPDAYYLNDLEGNFIDGNKTAEELLGYKREELIGKSFLEAGIMSPDQILKAAKILEKGFKGQQARAEEFELKRKDEERISVEISSIPIKLKGEKVFLGIARDITERKRLEESLRQAQKMEAIGTLAGGIAHDFNNILSPLLGYTEMLKEDLPADHPFQANADTMLSSTLRARDLVQQILAFSKKSKSEIKPIKLQPIAKEAIKLLRSSIPKTIEMNQSIDSGCGSINADPTQFHQIIMNLATNAYHAMEQTGGKLTITLNQVHIERDSPDYPGMLPGAYARLTVADTGIGIKSDVIEKIFDPYFTTKETGKGTGLGLSVVHGIVKNSGGDIRIYSEPGKGTDIHVYIPIIEREAAKRVETTGPVIGGTERILMVDDEEAIIRMQKMMLERLGYRITTRIGSIEALEAFKANPDKFDMIVTDMTMPNMTGIQLAQKIKNVKSDIPIIICTGFSEQLTDEKCQALDIQGYVMKPVIIRELAETIRNVLDNKKGE